jgi:hypothetical protein
MSDFKTIEQRLEDRVTRDLNSAGHKPKYTLPSCSIINEAAKNALMRIHTQHKEQRARFQALTELSYSDREVLMKEMLKIEMEETVEYRRVDLLNMLENLLGQS